MVPQEAVLFAPIEGSADIRGAGSELDGHRVTDTIRDQAVDIHEFIDADNIADQLPIELLRRLGTDVYDGWKIDDQSRGEWKEIVLRSRKLAMQKTQRKQYPWNGASNVIWPLITTATNEFGARAYPAIVQGRNVVKGQVIGDDQGVPMEQAGPMPGGTTGAQMMQPQQPQISQQPGGALPGLGGPPMQQPGGAQPQPQQPPQQKWLVEPGVKAKRAKRIGDHMSWQLLGSEYNPNGEWEANTDLLVHALPGDGCCVRKTYYDQGLKKNRSLYVSMLQVVVNFHAKSLESAPRITEELELYPHEIEQEIAKGAFCDFDYGRAAFKEGYQNDPSTPHDFLEQHCWFDADDDGMQEPYVVTVHKETQKVVRVVARYDQDSLITGDDGVSIIAIEPINYYTLYGFIPNPDSAIYYQGFGHMLLSINESINTAVNQMFDAGTLQNNGGGFVGTGLSLLSGPIKFRMGQYMPVNTNGQSIQNSVFPIPFPGPSATLFQLLGLLIEAGKEVGQIKDALTGQATGANIAPTTIIALIQQGLQVFNGIYKRIYRSLQSEFAKLYRLNCKHLSQEQHWKVGEEWRSITPEDYKAGAGVQPVGDPTVVTAMQQTGRAALLLSLKDDARCDGRKLIVGALEMSGVEDGEDFLSPEGPQPEQMMQMAELHAKLGTMRAEEMKNQAQAILFMAQAQKASGDGKLAQFESMLEQWRLHMEAITIEQRKHKEIHDMAIDLHTRAWEAKRITHEMKAKDRKLAIDERKAARPTASR